MNAQQTSPGRLRRLALGFLIGALLVTGFTVYVSQKGGTYDSGANLGRRDNVNRAFGAPRRTPYPESKTRRENRGDRQVVFILRQAGRTVSVDIVTVIDRGAKNHRTTEGTWKRNAPDVHSGSIVSISAGLTPYRVHDPAGAGPLECVVVINGLIYQDHMGRHPYNVGQDTCQASAVVP